MMRFKHTHPPVFYLAMVRFKRNSKFYQAIVRKLPKGTGVQLREISEYGAVMHLITGTHRDGNLEEFRLSKKKVRWSEMVFYLFGPGKAWDEEIVREFKSEASKHGLVVIEKEES